MGNSFASAGKLVAATFGAVAAIGIGKAAVGFLSLNANAEQYRISLETVTGSQAKANALFDDLAKFAKDTPFEFPELVQASINLEAFGLKTQDWITTIGDTASAMGKSVDQTTQAVMDASSGEYERLKEFGIKARIEGDKVVLSYRDQTVEIDKNNKERILSTVKSFWNSGYAGAMKKQSKTFNGQLSTLKDNWNMTMQRMTGGFFNFSKGVLSEGNEFFNLFNRKLDAGLDPVHAALSALHVTLDQVFGKAAGDRIDATLRGIVDGVGAVGGAVIELGGDLLRGDFGEFFSDLGDDLKALASEGLKLGDVAVDVGKWVLSDGIPDLWDWFKKQIGVGPRGDGTDPGASVTLGDVAIDAALKLGGALLDAASDFGGWLKPKLVGGFSGAVDLGSLALSAVPHLASDIWGQFTSGYDWFVDQLGLDNHTAGAPVSVGDVALTAGSIVLDSALDLAGKATSAIEGWFADHPSIIAALDDWTLHAGAPTVEWALDLSWDDFIGQEVNNEKIRAELTEWVIILSLPSFEVEGGGGMGGDSPLWQGLKDQLKGTRIPIGPVGMALSPPFFEGLEHFNDWLQTAAKKFQPYHLSEWTMNLGTPTILGMMLVDWVTAKVRDLGDIDINLPSWNLRLPTPAGITNVNGVDLAAQVAFWINNKIQAIEDLAATVLSWDLKVPTPEFPNLADAFTVIVWIEDQLDSLGSFVTDIIDGAFSINVPSPLFPNLTFANVWSWINSQISSLGDFVFSLPVSLNLVPDVHMPDINIPIPGTSGINIPGFAGGGTVRSPLAMVGERGPELVSLPYGSYVHTAAQTAAMRRGGRSGGGGGGDTYYMVDLSNAIVGRGAMAEIQKMVSTGVARAVPAMQSAHDLTRARR